MTEGGDPRDSSSHISYHEQQYRFASRSQDYYHWRVFWYVFLCNKAGNDVIYSYLLLGIGRSVAAASLAHGASVVIASSSSDKVKSAIAWLQHESKGATVEGQALDIKDYPALKSFLDRHGPFNHLVSQLSGSHLSSYHE